jgi:predicted RNA binding protein YcfA (HicA-like mRNA interferase family)
VTKIPNLPYRAVVKAFQRAGFVVIRQRGSHIRLRKHSKEEVINITIPAHTSIKKSTLSKILKDAGLTFEEFKEFLS